MKERLQRLKVYAIPAMFGILAFVLFTFSLLPKINKNEIQIPTKLPRVTLPVIGDNGELVLSSTSSGQLEKPLSSAKIGVLSANLAAIYDKEKMTGVRILGEMINFGDLHIDAVDPVVRFFNKKGSMISQKIAKFSTNYDFYEVPPKDKIFYDITVDSPPISDRLEIVFNVVSSTGSAKFLPLKIASRSMELKSADVQAKDSSSSAQQIEYYTVTGKIVNTFSNLISDITVYAWGKDVAGRVFASGRADFKNDLISPSGQVEFKIVMLPIQQNQKLESYEVAAWGKEYKLLTSPGN